MEHAMTLHDFVPLVAMLIPSIVLVLAAAATILSP
jgi:hypothetical protein